MPRTCTSSNKAEAPLRCYWLGCDFTLKYSDFTVFREHVYAHVQSQLDQLLRETTSTSPGSCKYSCQWAGCDAHFGIAKIDCGENGFTAVASRIAMHISVHVYHARLMAVGETQIELEKKRGSAEIQCKQELSCRRIFSLLEKAGIYDTSSTAFQCGWRSCLFETPSVTTFFTHVASHADDDSVSTSSAAIDSPKSNKRASVTTSSKRSSSANKESTCDWSDCPLTASADGDRAGQGLESDREDRKTRIFTNPYRLVEHLRTHTGERVAACPQCGAVFSSYTKLRDHFYAQLSRQNAPETADVDPANASKATDKVNKKGDATQFQFSCSVCTKRFATERLLRDHIRKHLNMFKCARCGLTCTSSSAVRRHIHAVHLRTPDQSNRVKNPDADDDDSQAANDFDATLLDNETDYGNANVSSNRRKANLSKRKAFEDEEYSQSDVDGESVTSCLPELSDSGSEGATYTASVSASVSASASASSRRRSRSSAKKARRETVSVPRVFECHICAPTRHDHGIAASMPRMRAANGRFEVRSNQGPGPFRFSRGAQLTRHLMEAHAIDYPTGHRRFRYSRDADGIFRLSAIRYETELLTTIDLDDSGEPTVVQHGAAPRSPAPSSVSASASASASNSASASVSVRPRPQMPLGEDDVDADSEDGFDPDAEWSDSSFIESASDRLGDDPASVSVQDPFRLDFDEVNSQITFTYNESEYD